MYALIDSNNFFVSCERLFRPDLADKPVVVLSSNDGCAVSRSAEAKALGIPMGAPIFKYRELFSRQGVVACSANFELYGDISERISTYIASITPRIEVYSIDESFLDLSDLEITSYADWGSVVREGILRTIGIPVSVGVAPTKTLCKLANHWAKQHASTGGVFTLHTPDESSTHTVKPAHSGSHETTLKATPVEDVWGVGWRLAPRLRAEGVLNALDLARMRPKRAQQLMGIHGRQMVYELNGTRCIPLQLATKPQAMISRGRQFGADTSDVNVIEAAVAALVARAARELRRERQLAARATVTLRTNYHKPGYKSISRSVAFATPTADTGIICGQLAHALRSAVHSNTLYHKADVLLDELSPHDRIQTDVLGDVDLTNYDRSQARMRAVDTIHAKYGPTGIRPAAEALSTAWQPRSNMRSPRYTSSWDELPEALLKWS